MSTPGERERGLIIMPAYNEAEAIGPLIRELREHVPELDVVVVDDGSIDGTPERVPAGAGVHLLRLPFNLGIGGAMQTGYRFAASRGYAFAVQVDGDGQHPPDQIPLLLERLRAGDADLVIGSRFLGEGTYRQTITRAAGSRGLGVLLRVLTGRQITDCTSGFRVATRPIIEAYAHWYPDDYPEPEAVLLLHRAGFRIVETPVVMRPRTTGSTSIPLPRGLFYVLKVSAALLLDMIRAPWPNVSRRSPHKGNTP
jgi:glycosyltransferase involved in cell wall biosynthesis